MDQHTLDRIRSNDHRALSRVITQIESGQPISDTFFKEVHTLSHDALRIGITGPPGAGKGTLTDQLIQILINDGKSVGVVAVDPTSPFTGGALLGDRVRMNHYLFNDNVFIRSMGSHGDLGGLARKAQDVGDLLAASGKDVIIFETVGVGQGEHDVANVVDLTAVVLVPESGDEIQLMKAGLIEIADLFIVNKSDRDGSARLAQSLKTILHTFKQKGKLEPPVYSTSADRNNGIDELYNGILDHIKLMANEGTLKTKQLDRYRNRVFKTIEDELLNKFWTRKKLQKMEISIQNLELINISPREMANLLMEENDE